VFFDIALPLDEGALESHFREMANQPDHYQRDAHETEVIWGQEPGQQYHASKAGNALREAHGQ
jgi:hypothetical protein